MARRKNSEHFDDILRLSGMLTTDEVECLYRMAQSSPGKGVILEIGSWKGKSTVALARGSISVAGEKVYAVDPHRPLAEEGYLEDTEAEFRNNIKEAQVEHHIVPMIMTSEQAAKGWNQPIRLLWIDGDHRYEQVRLDFFLWERHVIDGGIIAMHDTIRKSGPKRVLWENIFRSDRFERISIVDNITAATKVAKTSLPAKLTKWSIIGCRGLYIGARKLNIPGAKPAGRWVLRRLTD